MNRIIVVRTNRNKEAFAYDKAGNRWADRNEWKYKYNKANQLIKTSSFTYTYDSNGNLISKTLISNPSTLTSYSYNSENQLIEVKTFSPTNHSALTTIRFSYDALGRRIKKEVVDAQTLRPQDSSLILGGFWSEPIFFELKY